MLRQSISSLTRQLLVSKNGTLQRRNAATKVALKNTLDDYPIPTGSWETNYKAKQQKYNMHLAFGVIFTIVTLVSAKASNLIHFYHGPPPLPKN